jgi:hypothetical protein
LSDWRWRWCPKEQDTGKGDINDWRARKGTVRLVDYAEMALAMAVFDLSGGTDVVPTVFELRRAAV